MYSFLKAFLVLMKLLSLSQFYAPKFFILDHNFWTRNVKKSIKGWKDSNFSLVSNENLSETLWPSGWALDQATWAKSYFAYDVTHKKTQHPTSKIYIYIFFQNENFLI